MSYEVNGTLLREKIPNVNINASGSIGTAASTVDVVSHLAVATNAAGYNLTLPNPTDTRSGRDVRVTNAGGFPFIMYGHPVGTNAYSDFSWDGNWHAVFRGTLAGLGNLLPGNIVPNGYTEAQFFNGSWAPTITIPVGGVDPGEIFTYGHFAGFDTTIQIANTNMAQPLLVTQAMGSVTFMMGQNGKWNLVSERLERSVDFPLQNLLTLNGIARVSRTGEVSWTNRFITMGPGVRAQETSGFHQMDMPPVGTLIPVGDGSTRAVVAATAGDTLAKGGVLLNAWETLWYRAVRGSNSTSVPANYRIMQYTQANNGAAPNSLLGQPASDSGEWIMICSRDDANNFKWGNGDTSSYGGVIGTATDLMMANWAMMKTRIMGNGYFYSPGGASTIPNAFGFTGDIYSIGGGAQAYTNTAGAVQVNSASRAAGQVVRVMGGADRVWRVMTAAEKPAWFGGALRGVNAINAATSTVVDLNNNETLCWVPDLTASTITGSWYIFPFSFGASIPFHSIPVASRQDFATTTNIQVLIGGMQMSLRAGEARYSSIGSEGPIDRLHRKVTHKGIKHCRWAHAGIFTGTGLNGVTNGANGLFVSWDDNTAVYGISDGYSSWGNQYTFINVPSSGYQIPVVSTGSSVTRQVTTIGGRRFIPLAPWEALYLIPPANGGGSGSVDGDFVISYFGGNHFIPAGSVLVAKYEAAAAATSGSGISKTRVLFMDGTYIQPGLTFPPSAAAAAINDHAHNTGEWRDVTVAGGTSPGNTAALPAIVGIQANFAQPFTLQYRNLTLDGDPRGMFQLKGMIQMNASVTTPNADIAFIPGIIVIGQPILTLHMAGSVFGDEFAIPTRVRLINNTVGTQQGVVVRVMGSAMNSALNPFMTLGSSGGATAPQQPFYVSFDGLGPIPCA